MKTQYRILAFLVAPFLVARHSGSAAILSSTLPANLALEANFGGGGFVLDRSNRLMALPVSLAGQGSDYRFEEIRVVVSDGSYGATNKTYSLEIWSDTILYSSYQPGSYIQTFGTSAVSEFPLENGDNRRLVSWTGSFDADSGELYWLVLRGSDDAPMENYANFGGLAYATWDTVQAITGPLNASHPGWGFSLTSMDNGSSWSHTVGWDGAPLRISYAYEISGSAIAVPEPSAFAAILGGIVLASAALRRRPRC